MVGLKSAMKVKEEIKRMNEGTKKRRRMRI